MRDETPPLPTGVLTRRILITLLIAVVLLAAGVGAFRALSAKRKEPERAEQHARAVAVRTTRLERIDYREQIDGYGSARALRRASVAAEIGGVVRWIAPKLEAGAEVKQDEILVRLDDRDAKSALESAVARLDRIHAAAGTLESDLKTARSKVAIVRRELLASKRELERIENLQGQEVATASEYDKQSMATALRESALLDLEGRISSFQSQLERNRAEAREAEANRDRAKHDLGRAEVRAPHAGRIELRHVNPGDRVAVGNALFEVVDLSRIEIPVAIAALHFGAVQEKAAAEIRLGGNDALTWTGIVARIAPTVSVQDRTFYAYLLVESGAPTESVPPGAFVSARIEGRLFRNVFVLPRSALLGDHVYVVRDGVARVCTPHVVTNLPHAAIADQGVEAGELLITSNLEEVAEGTRVTVSSDGVVESSADDS